MTTTPTRTTPESGAYIPLRMRMSVLFPAPFSPMSAWISPGASSSEAPRLATTGPKLFTMSRISTAGAATGGAGWGVLIPSAPGSSRR